jgi:energy-coupling factor transporter transmembrane protein EcfT
MSVFFFVRKDTFLHRTDPRVKLLLLAAFFVAVAVVKNISVLACVFAGLAVLFVAAKSTANMAKMAVLFCAIGAATFVLWLVFYRGIPGGRAEYAVAMSLRFVDLLLAGLLFLSVTSLEEFSHGLMLLGMPYPMAFGLSLSFRLVTVFIATGFTIVEAQKVRGNNVSQGPFMKRIRAYAPLLVPLILSGIKKAETLTLALESKGFSPHNKIDPRDRYAMRLADWVLCAVGLGAALAVIMMKIRGLL